MSDDTMFAHRLRVTRLALGLTEPDAAKAFKVTLQTYRRYEAGKSRPAFNREIAFAIRYGISLDWLLRGETSGVKPTHGRVVVLPAKTVWYRNSIITNRIGSILPNNKRDAIAALEWATECVDLYCRSDEESQVVQFPSR